MGNRSTKANKEKEKEDDATVTTEYNPEKVTVEKPVSHEKVKKIVVKPKAEEGPEVIGDREQNLEKEKQEDNVKEVPEVKPKSAHIEAGYFKGHDCMWEAEHLARYEIRCGVIRKFIMYLTCPRSLDWRARNMYRSYAGLFAEVRRQFVSHPFTIHPFSRLRLAIEIFVFLNYHMVLTSMALYLEQYETNPYQHYSIVIPQWCYIIFIISNFFTGYVVGTTDTHVVLDNKKIVLRYLRTWFIIDALYPWGLIIYYYKLVGDNSIQADTVVFTTKVLRLPTIFSFSENFMNRFDFSEKLKTISHIIILISNYILWNVFFQFTTEIFYEKSLYPINPRSCSWITVARLWNASVADRRAFAFNRAIGMLRRHSNVAIVEEGACTETFFIIFWLIGWLVCVHCAAKFMTLRIGEESAKARFHVMAQQVKTYMEQQRYPERIKQKALTFYAVRFHSIFFSEQKMMSCMSGQLREDIIMHINRQLVSQVEFLKELPRSLILSIGTKLKIVVFLAGDIIFKINAVADCLYFIDKGTVAVYSESGVELCHLQDGDYFGEIALVLPPRFRVASVVAITNCHLFRLDKKDFDATIARFPTVYEDIKQGALNRRERLRVIDEHHKAESGEWNEAQENND